MSFFVNWTWGPMEDQVLGPGMFSWFHFLWLGIMVAFCIVISLSLAKRAQC